MSEIKSENIITEPEEDSIVEAIAELEISSSEDLNEKSKEASSNFQALTVTTQTQASASVILQWTYNRPQSIEPSQQVIFKLLKLESKDEWKAIAWTRKATCKIANLEQNVCYSLQLLALVKEGDEFNAIDRSDIFKVILYIHTNLIIPSLSTAFSAQFK